MATFFQKHAVLAVSCAMIAAVSAAAPAQARHNPVDPVSNADRLDYPNVEMTLPEYAEPFRRDGALSDPATFLKVVPGLSSANVGELLGEPLSRTYGKKGWEWNYNITFKLPQSGHYMVCQYKVVFNADAVVQDSVWRRRQCLDRVNAAKAPAAG